MDKNTDKASGEIKLPVKSSVLKCGKRTYFFDIYLAQNNKNYLKITESRFVEEGQDRKRNTMILFPDDVLNFQSRLDEAIGYVNQAA